MTIGDIQPVVKDGCGVFGVLRKNGAERIGNSAALEAIECVRYRGSDLGSGFAAFTASPTVTPPYRVKVFVHGDKSLRNVREIFARYSSHGLKMVSERSPSFGASGRFGVYTVMMQGEEKVLSQAVSRVNQEMWGDDKIEARVYSCGRYLNVYKDVGYPLDVARKCNLVEDRVFADAWIAHTRQPTNSPGVYPVWSHPFASFEFAIVHNGDVSSFGLNTEFLDSIGMTRHVGTDSEVIARLLDYLVRVRGLRIEDAARVISNPFEGWLEAGEGGERLGQLTIGLRGAQLDGPFTVVAGYCDGYDTYILGLVDRSKFRPIVVGEDDNRIFIASEECQIRTISPNAKVWTPEPGRVVLASVQRGFLETGRSERELFVGYSFQRRLVQPSVAHRPSVESRDSIDARGLTYRVLNDKIFVEMAKGKREVNVVNVNGHRYLGVNLQRPDFCGSKLVVHGFPGNCLANFNNGLEFVVYGNVSDDVGDVMHAGKVIIHGDARDVVGQALQGGEVFVRGSVGNRAAIQMREYADRRPFLIVGGRADDYLGEYMAGGITVVLGLDARTGDEPQLVGGFVGTGMVGGKILIRAKVRREAIGLPPPRDDVANYLHSLVLDGLLSQHRYEHLLNGSLDFSLLQEELPPLALQRVRRFYEGKYIRPLASDYRELNSEEYGLIEPRLKDYFACFGLTDKLYERVVSSKFTVISNEAERQEKEGEATIEE